MFAMCGVMSGNSRFHELHYVRDYLGWSSPGRLSASWIVDSKVEEMCFPTRTCATIMVGRCGPMQLLYQIHLISLQKV